MEDKEHVTAQYPEVGSLYHLFSLSLATKTVQTSLIVNIVLIWANLGGK